MDVSFLGDKDNDTPSAVLGLVVTGVTVAAAVEPAIPATFEEREGLDEDDELPAEAFVRAPRRVERRSPPGPSSSLVLEFHTDSSDEFVGSFPAGGIPFCGAARRRLLALLARLSDASLLLLVVVALPGLPESPAFVA